MFWRKKPKVDDQVSELLRLASRLGVEKRQFVRIRYPRRQVVCQLPEFRVHDRSLIVYDISLGGCCLLDPDEILGPSIGHEVDLVLAFPSGPETVRSRIVSRVDHRRHIQFLNLSEARQAQVKKSMSTGVRGLSVRRVGSVRSRSVAVSASEMWSSLHGDSVVLDNDVHRIARVHLGDTDYTLFREAWPLTGDNVTCTKPEFEQILLFLTNIPLPSGPLTELVMFLETQFTNPYTQGAP